MKSKCGAPNETRKVCCQIQNQFVPQSLTLFENDDEQYETGKCSHFFVMKTKKKCNLTFLFEFLAKPASSPLLPDHQTCGVDLTKKIFGGKITDIREFPWLVYIEFSNSSMLYIVIDT